MNRPRSHLKLAWGILIGGIAALMVAAVLAPEPDLARSGVELALPEEPDGLAPLPSRGSSVLDRTGGAEPEAEGRRRLPEIVFGEAPGEVSTSSGEVVITIGGEDSVNSRVRPAVPPAAPDPALTADTSAGKRPNISSEGKTPFSAYRRLESLGQDRGVAVVVSGLGLDTELTAKAIALPPAVSLAFAPYGKDLADQMERARKAGHEVLIELPMGTPGVAPAALGPAGLLADRAPRANKERLDWLLSRSAAYPMATNYLGRGFSGDAAAISQVMALLSRAGLGYVDDTGLAAPAARAAGVPYAATDLLIEPRTADVSARLEELTSAARPGDVRLAKVYASAESVAAVDGWTKTLPADAALVPASSAVTAR